MNFEEDTNEDFWVEQNTEDFILDEDLLDDEEY